MSYQRSRKYSLCIPTDSNTNYSSYKKNPPWLIKISTSKDALNSQKLIKTIQSDIVYHNQDSKQLSETLPPICAPSKMRSKKTKLFSPKYQMHYQNLKPLFTKKKKVDQSLSTRIDSWEIDTQVIENSYKISVITKKVM